MKFHCLEALVFEKPRYMLRLNIVAIDNNANNAAGKFAKAVPTKNQNSSAAVVIKKKKKKKKKRKEKKRKKKNNLNIKLILIVHFDISVPRISVYK